VDTTAIQQALRADGYVFVPADGVRHLLGVTPLAGWEAFAASWNNLPLDAYMADGGRYRRRRYATLSVAPGATVATLEAHQPHYQSLDYNNLNGGIARHYEPVAPDIITGEPMHSMFSLAAGVFNGLAPATAWHVETHQFRIEARTDICGQPTPEGVHRDGVDYVMVMMVQRHNIAEGTTTIHGNDGQQLASFTLIEPLDMTFVDDHRCLHGVTPVVPLDATQPAWRDVLVVTFRKKPTTQGVC
jgi:hypothetical protein